MGKEAEQSLERQFQGMGGDEEEGRQKQRNLHQQQEEQTVQIAGKKDGQQGSEEETAEENEDCGKKQTGQGKTENPDQENMPVVCTKNSEKISAGCLRNFLLPHQEHSESRPREINSGNEDKDPFFRPEPFHVSPL